MFWSCSRIFEVGLRVALQPVGVPFRFWFATASQSLQLRLACREMATYSSDMFKLWTCYGFEKL